MTVAYAGKHLTISLAFDRELRREFPNLNMGAQYEAADEYLQSVNPSKRWRNVPLAMMKRLRAIEAVKQEVLDRYKRNQGAK